jgi:cell division protein FtsW
MIRIDPRIDRTLLFSTLVLVALGLVMVFNASIPISQAKFRSTHFLFYRQLVWAVGGLVVFLAAIHLPLRWLERRWSVAAVLGLTYVLLAAVFTQAPINGTRRWFHAFGVSFQPSELAKFAAVFFLAWYLSRHDDIRERPWRHLARVLAVIAPMLGLIVFEPDLGSVVMIMAFTVILLFLAEFPVKYLLYLAGAALPLLVAVILVSPYQLNRIKTFIDPMSDPQGKGYQVQQSLIAMGHSGFWGLGPGESTQKLFFLPEPHTDFIYAVVGEELGFLGCLVVTGLFTWLFYRGMKVAHRTPSNFRCWLGIGLITLITLPALINTSMVVALGPTKGIPLPFVSMGGTSLVMNLLAMALVINISREVTE